MTTKHQLLVAVQGADLAAGVRAIRSLPSLRPRDALEILAYVLQTRLSLALRIEALSTVPDIITKDVANEVCRLLTTALADSDIDIVQQALLAVQRLPRDSVTNDIVDALFAVLASDDTDIQYGVVLALAHLHSLIDPNRLRTSVTPLAGHPNHILQAAASDLLDRLAL